MIRGAPPGVGVPKRVCPKGTPLDGAPPSAGPVDEPEQRGARRMGEAACADPRLERDPVEKLPEQACPAGTVKLPPARVPEGSEKLPPAGVPLHVALEGRGVGAWHAVAGGRGDSARAVCGCEHLCAALTATVALAVDSAGDAAFTSGVTGATVSVESGLLGVCMPAPVLAVHQAVVEPSPSSSSASARFPGKKTSELALPMAAQATFTLSASTSRLARSWCSKMRSMEVACLLAASETRAERKS